MTPFASLHQKIRPFLLLAVVFYIPWCSGPSSAQELGHTFALSMVHRYDQQTWLELSGSLAVYPVRLYREETRLSLEASLGLQATSLFQDPVQALSPREWSFGLGLRGLGPPAPSMSYTASSFVGVGLWGSAGIDLGLYVQGGVLLPINAQNDLSLSVRLLEDGSRQRADVQLGWQLRF
jgi:hypothetical protein